MRKLVLLLIATCAFAQVNIKTVTVAARHRLYKTYQPPSLVNQQTESGNLADSFGVVVRIESTYRCVAPIVLDIYARPGFLYGTTPEYMWPNDTSPDRGWRLIGSVQGKGTHTLEFGGRAFHSEVIAFKESLHAQATTDTADTVLVTITARPFAYQWTRAQASTASAVGVRETATAVWNDSATALRANLRTNMGESARVAARDTAISVRAKLRAEMRDSSTAMWRDSITAATGRWRQTAMDTANAVRGKVRDTVLVVWNESIPQVTARWRSDISDTADAVRIADTAAAVLLARSRNVLTGQMLAVTGTGDTILLVNGANTADSAIWTFKGDSVVHRASVPVLWLGSWRQLRNRTIVDTLYAVLDSTARLSVTGSMAFTGSGLVCTTSAGNAARVWLDTVKGRVVNMTSKVYCSEVAANGTRLDIQSSSGNIPSASTGGTWSRFGNTTRTVAANKSDTLLLFNPTVRSRTNAGRTVLISTNPTIDSGVVTHAEFGHNSTVSGTKIVDGWADTTLLAYKRDSVWGNRYTGGSMTIKGIPGGAPACSAGVGTRVVADTAKANYLNVPTIMTTGYLTSRPHMDYSSIIGSGKPTAVVYGAWDGFSLPAYAANEEIHWRDYVPGRWDSISDPTYTVSFVLDGLEDVDDTVRLVLHWTSKKFSSGQIANTFKRDTVKVPIAVGRNVAYSVYTATFTLDYDNVSFPIAYGSEITGDLRRAEAGLLLDIAGEIIVFDQRLTYRVDKAFKQSSP